MVRVADNPCLSLVLRPLQAFTVPALIAENDIVRAEGIGPIIINKGRTVELSWHDFLDAKWFNDNQYYI